jgi:ABC-2 type transport system permease protein
MVNLFRAEWTKIAGHRWLTSCLIWIFPVGAVGFTVAMSAILLLSESARTSFGADTVTWTETLVGAWSFLNNPLGRLLLIGFTAVMFAGEYQWQTWKNLIPRNRRVALILNKFLALSVFVIFAFALMSVLLTVGMGLLRAIAGASYGPEITGEVLRTTAADYARSAGLGFLSTLIAAGYAALAGMFSRSILGGVLVAYGLTIAENLSLVALLLIAIFLDFRTIVHLYRFLPGYNLQNLDSWFRIGEPAPLEIAFSGTDRLVVRDSAEFSALVIAAWVVGLIGLTVYLFRRQDITS